MTTSQDNLPVKTSTSYDELDNHFLSRLALEGGMMGLGAGGLVSLAYMLAEAFRDKPRAAEKREEVEDLSPFIPSTGVSKFKSSQEKQSDGKESEYSGFFGPIREIWDEGSRGALMVPAAATAAVVPAWLAFKFLQNRYESSRVSQLERELEVARDNFRDALAGDTKISADIDSVIDDYRSVKTAETVALGGPPDLKLITGSPDQPRTSEDHLGGKWGLAAGTLSLTALLAAYMSYKLLDRTMRTGHPKVEALKAMKELQRRRQAISGVTPYVHIDRDESGQLLPRI